MKFIRLILFGFICVLILAGVFIYFKISPEKILPKAVDEKISSENNVETENVVDQPKELDFEIPKYKWLSSDNWIKPTTNNPVLYPTEKWEGKNVLEPTVIFEDGIFKMWYCGGSPCALGYATSKDGITWEKYPNNPIFGLGHGEETGTVRQNNVIKYNDKYYLYYVNDSFDMHIAESSDGINFTKRAEPVLNHLDVPLERSLANSYQWSEDNKWFMIYEAQDNDGYALWKMRLATGKDQYTWENYSGNPLYSIQTGKGMYGGPWVKKINDVYYLFHHASVPQDFLPTDIYVHYSKDLHNWYPIKDAPLIKRTRTDWEIDQVADPYLIEVNGKTYMYYDGDDNTTKTGYRAWIGYVYFDGKLEDLPQQE